MKLLLVEDERLTREGIRDEINWVQLGITEIVEAVDGIHALSMIEHFHPDIVLTDIRMPRMNGVELATELRRDDPNCKIIFMSGYADKEYLKAAISLKAISYVEKPIDIEELSASLQNATSLCIEERLHFDLEAVNKQTIDASSFLVKREAALELISEAFDDTFLLQRLELAGFLISHSYSCATVLLKIVTPLPNQEAITAIVDDCLQSLGYTYLFAPKNELHFILHLFGKEHRLLDHLVLQEVCLSLSSSLKDQYIRYSITAGDIVNNYIALKQSYTLAVVRMQEAFYQRPCSIVISDSLVEQSPSNDVDQRQLNKEFYDALHNERFNEVEELIQQLSDSLRQRPNELVSAAKEVYYRFLLEMDRFANQRGLTLFSLSSESDHPWEMLHQCHYLDDVKDTVLLKLQHLLEAVTTRGKGGVASRIMKYIHEHYSDDNLSVGEISNHLKMTSSHIISVFKESTGCTIKQYLMEYRIEKAKELLANDRLKVFDIASQVGYKEGEYFAKIFRKFTGMTPSSYRERIRP